MKEALKALCGVNQWSYAVFWKIGIQNPKLLIWEECYHHESTSSSTLPGFHENENTETAFLHDYNIASWISDETRNIMESGAQTNEKVHILVNKMMMDNHINIVGEGLVGRVALTGQHQWILTENFYRENHPPEVLKELCQQFSAGMQTVAIIPVLPHGVIQFGSFLMMTEDKRFVDHVKSTVLQLGNVHGGLLAENYEVKELIPEFKIPLCPENSMESNLVNPNVAPLEALSSCLRHLMPGDYHQETKIAPYMKLDSFSLDQSINGGIVKAAALTPSNQEIWMNQRASDYIPWSSSFIEPPSSSGQSHFITSNNLMKNYLPSYSSGNEHHEMDYKFRQSEFSPCKVKRELSTTQGVDIPLSHHNEDHLGSNELITKYDNTNAMPQSGDDLFDILGADFKNKLFGSCNNTSSYGSDSYIYEWDQHIMQPKNSMASSDVYCMSLENSDSGIFTLNTDNHLLDAMISTGPSTTKNLNENVSCGTIIPSNSLPYGRFEELIAPKPVMKVETSSVGSFRSASSKEVTQTNSRGSSMYGSQISSWIDEKGHKAKQSNSVSTGYSKKSEETSKANRKRLKPGENPRPRPKDRQMIQDRVKELREIIPNGAKCSIDALLERTIKHMLFLESVAKHADKLKQSGDSKILSKDGGLLLKDNNLGGATWAYEVGSQSMVCPIIVEDLNQPRQMFVEMLCEQRGLFLEIADIIRGMGLTILKGVMETRNDKIWARFAVEANRDVTRIEIFISLVRLLEQSAKTGAAQTNISNENMMSQ